MKNLTLKIENIQNSRAFWLVLAFISSVLICIAHFFFQEYLFMKPCKLCINIRYSFLIIAIFCSFTSINPKNNWVKIIGYLGVFVGIFKGVLNCIALNGAYNEVRTLKQINTQSCSASNFSPFQNHISNLAPTWFQASGSCGNDAPAVPVDAKLSVIQNYFIDLYSDGWYLIPKYHFINMAQFCFIIFCIFFITIGLAFLNWVYKKFLPN